MNSILIDVKNINQTFHSNWGSVEALRKVNFSCSRGEFISVVGSSGCGKTTLLRIIAGLEEPTDGEVWFDGKRTVGPSHDRAVVFQEPRLFPWLTVEKNIAFGILNKRRPHEREAIVEQTLHLVGLSSFKKAYPYELSGGMSQRVAIGRALAFEPKALLMDEPFSALDAQTRKRMQVELFNVWQKTEKTIVLVTHDIEEALVLSKKILIMSPSPGTVKEILEVPLSYPRNQDSSEFIELRKYIVQQIL